MLRRTEPLDKAIGALQKLVKRHKHPAIKAALGALYVEALDGDAADPAAAVAFLEDALRTAPTNATLANQLAKALAHATHATHTTSNERLRQRMVEALQRAAELKREELSSLLMELAHVALKVGRSEDACAHAQVAKLLAESNEEAGEFLKDMTLDGGGVAKGSQHNHVGLTAEVAKVRGFLAAMVTDATGEIVAVENALDVDERTLGNALGVIYNNARDAALRMEIGDFELCEIDGPFGRAYVAALADGVLFAVFDENARGEAAPGRLEHIIESCAVGDQKGGNNPR